MQLVEPVVWVEQVVPLALMVVADYRTVVDTAADSKVAVGPRQALERHSVSRFDVPSWCNPLTADECDPYDLADA